MTDTKMMYEVIYKIEEKNRKYIKNPHIILKSKIIYIIELRGSMS